LQQTFNRIYDTNFNDVLNISSSSSVIPMGHEGTENLYADDSNAVAETLSSDQSATFGFGKRINPPQQLQNPNTNKRLKDNTAVNNMIGVQQKKVKSIAEALKYVLTCSKQEKEQLKNYRPPLAVTATFNTYNVTWRMTLFMKLVKQQFFGDNPDTAALSRVLCETVREWMEQNQMTAFK
jgi:hypothetical protein